MISNILFLFHFFSLPFSLSHSLLLQGMLCYAPVGQCNIIVLDSDTLKIDTTMELDGITV